MKQKIQKCFSCKQLIEMEQELLINKHKYHKNCYEKIYTKKQIRDFYIEEICSTVVIQQLNGVIKNLIEVKNVEPQFLLFAVKYIKNNNLNIRSPMGLHYYINDQRIITAYAKTKIKKQNIEVDDIEIEKPHNFNYVVSHKDRIADLLGG